MHAISKRFHMKTSEDLISQLPDHLLHHILLKLPTKDSVKTSVLSTRWRHLWQWVPGLDLNSFDFRHGYYLGCFVNRFLDLDKNSLVTQLKLSFDKSEIGRSCLNKWINSAVARGVQQLVVNASLVPSPNILVFNSPCIELPVSLCKCETLVHLNLDDIFMPSIGLFSLPCLETLRLRLVRFPSEFSLESLISSSQVLRVLDIDNINLEVFRVLSQTLNSLWIRFCKHRSTKSSRVVIDAPMLKCLSLEEDGIVNLALNSLCYPNRIVIDESEIETLSSFLAAISKVTNLTLSCYTLRAMSEYMRLKPVKPLLQLSNLTHLQVNIYYTVSELFLMFLPSCPNLKSLDMRNCCSSDILGISRSLVLKSFPTSLESVNIIITDGHFFEAKTKLVEYILASAALLETLTLDLHCCSEKEKYEFAKRILTFRRRSSACQVFFD